MEWWQQMGAIIGGLGALSALVAVVYKSGPERVKIIVDSAKVNIETSDELRDNLREEIAQLRKEMSDERTQRASERREFQQYKMDTENRMDELAAQLRGEKAEKRQLNIENAQLRARVDELETEVASLKEARQG